MIILMLQKMAQVGMYSNQAAMAKASMKEELRS